MCLQALQQPSPNLLFLNTTGAGPSQAVLPLLSKQIRDSITDNVQNCHKKHMAVVSRKLQKVSGAVTFRQLTSVEANYMLLCGRRLRTVSL
jgi:hypothetical protein